MRIVGVVSRTWVWLVGGSMVVVINWMWLECIGVVSGWCCKEVPTYKFPHIT